VLAIDVVMTSCRYRATVQRGKWLAGISMIDYIIAHALHIIAITDAHALKSKTSYNRLNLGSNPRAWIRQGRFNQC